MYLEVVVVVAEVVEEVVVREKVLMWEGWTPGRCVGKLRGKGFA